MIDLMRMSLRIFTLIGNIDAGLDIVAGLVTVQGLSHDIPSVAADVPLNAGFGNVPIESKTQTPFATEKSHVIHDDDSKLTSLKSNATS